MELGPRPPLIGGRARLVAVRIGVTFPESRLATYAVTPAAPAARGATAPAARAARAVSAADATAGRDMTSARPATGMMKRLIMVTIPPQDHRRAPPHRPDNPASYGRFATF